MIETLESRTFFAATLFHTVHSYQTGMVSNIVAGDFDGNGTVDLATNGGVMLLNDGRGVFRKTSGFWGRASTDDTNRPLTVAADFNGDGMDDIAGTFAGRFSVYFARGRGLFHLPVIYRHVNGIPTVADVNHDGHADIALSGVNCITILQNNGAGAFNAHTFIAPRVARNGEVVGPGQLAAADFDGDGDVDLFGGFFRLRTPIYFNDGYGDFSRKALIDVVTVGSVTGDFNRDRKADLIVNNHVLLGNGNGTFKPGVAIPGTLYAVLATADLNGDHRLDLIFPSIDTLEPYISVFIGRGNGTFTQLESLRPRDRRAVGAIRDFNGDGKPDLVAFQAPAGGMTAPSVLESYDGNYMTGDDFHLVRHYQPDTIAVLLS